tara:strand:+ start:9418 stop:10725 length:1308 start_codon:yes stop_codon:yes gene_type:complete
LQIVLPHNDWKPRSYQLPVWRYLTAAGKKTAYVVAHRRWGKDDVALHWTAQEAFRRRGVYWHMLPQASQARKAIWEAVNPHTGIRRIDEAFPKGLRAATRENEMFIRFKNESTWQVIGSDNYDSLVGAPPIGVVFSEWALAKPQAWAYIRPILAENDGTAFFITTPRGNNHAARMFNSMPDGAFVEKSTAYDTDVFTADQLEQERLSYENEYGASIGAALFEQEYLCSFDAAIVGSIFGKEVKNAEDQERICKVAYNPKKLVFTSWDLGEGDATSCWFFQLDDNQVNYIDYYEANREKTSHYLSMLRGKGYDYDTCYLPHDADHSRMNADQTIAGQFRSNGFRVDVIPQTPKKLQIAAGSNRIAAAYFDKEKCAAGLEGLKNYRWNYNKTLEQTTSTPVHDWASHPADAFMCGALGKDTETKPMEPLEYSNVGIV